MKNAAPVSLLFLASACMQIDIPVPVIDAPQGKGATGPCLTVHVTGDDALRADWTHAYAVSGIVRKRVTNRSGTLASISQSALENLALGYGTPRGENCPGELRFEFTKVVSVWQPPREFIEGPTPHRPGKIVIQFEGKAALTEKGKARASELVLVERRQNALPGEEGRVLADENAGALRELFVKTAAPLLATR